MKVVWRVVYIIYATILLLVAGSLSLQYQEQLYFKNEGQQALNSNDELEKFYFFYGSLGYHTRTMPPLIVENEDFILAFFEVYRTEEMKNTFYIMLYPHYAGFKPDDRVRYELVFNLSNNERKTIDFDQFRNMQMYIAVNQERQALIYVDEVQSKNPISITVNKVYAVIDEENQRVYTKTDEFTFPYIITDTELKVGSAVNQGLEELGINEENIQKRKSELDDYLINYNIYPKHHHSMKKYSYVFYLTIIGCVVAIVLGAYFLFFFRRGHKANMGRETPTRTFKDFGYKAEKYKDPLLVEDDLEDSK
jgi:hypothetical protein